MIVNNIIPANEATNITKNNNGYIEFASSVSDRICNAAELGMSNFTCFVKNEHFTFFINELKRLGYYYSYETDKDLDGHTVTIYWSEE